MSFASAQTIKTEVVAGIELHKVTRNAINYSTCLQDQKFESKVKGLPEGSEVRYRELECDIKLEKTDYISKEGVIDSAIMSNLDTIALEYKDNKESKCILKKAKVTDKKVRLHFDSRMLKDSDLPGLAEKEFQLCVQKELSEISSKSGKTVVAFYIYDTLGTSDVTPKN